MAGLKRKQAQAEIEEFLAMWNKLADYISQTVSSQKSSLDQEFELLELSGSLAKKAAYLAAQLQWGNPFVDKVTDFLHDVYSLRILPNQEEFQITLLRERWNAVHMEINNLAVR
jgi:hypothetical protein